MNVTTMYCKYALAKLYSFDLKSYPSKKLAKDITRETKSLSRMSLRGVTQCFLNAHISLLVNCRAKINELRLKRKSRGGLWKSSVVLWKA